MGCIDLLHSFNHSNTKVAADTPGTYMTFIECIVVVKVCFR